MAADEFIFLEAREKTLFKVTPWYLYLVVVEWLACLNDPESYAGGGIAARRVTHAGQVKGVISQTKKYLGRKSDDLSL